MIENTERLRRMRHNARRAKHYRAIKKHKGSSLYERIISGREREVIKKQRERDLAAAATKSTTPPKPVGMFKRFLSKLKLKEN